MQGGCENGGSCVEESNISRYMSDIGMDIGMCFCPPGYSGDRCQIEGNHIIFHLTSSLRFIEPFSIENES